MRDLRGYIFKMIRWLTAKTFPLLWYAYCYLQRPFHISSSAKIESICKIFENDLTITMPNNLSSSMVCLLTDLLQPNARKRLSCLQKLKNYQALKHLDFLCVEKQLVGAKFTPSNDRLNCDPTYELEEIMIESNPLHKKKRRKRKKSNVSRNILFVLIKNVYIVTFSWGFNN